MRAPSCALGVSAVLAVCGCHDWDRFSAHYDEATGDAGDCAPRSSSTCPATALACAGFEDGRIDTGWSSTVNDASALIDGTCPYRGASAMHVTSMEVAPPDGFRGDVTHDVIPFPPELYVRVFARFETVTPPPNDVRLISISQPAAGREEIVKMQGTSGNLLLVDQLGAGAMPTSVPVPLGRWFCLEAQILGGSDGHLRAWIDTSAGSASIDAVIVPDPAFSKVSVGPLASGVTTVQEPLEIWIDEIAIGERRMGCD